MDREDHLIWLKVEILKLERKFSTKDILRILAQEAERIYLSVLKMDKERKPGCAGPSPGEIGDCKRMAELLSIWK